MLIRRDAASEAPLEADADAAAASPSGPSQPSQWASNVGLPMDPLPEPMPAPSEDPDATAGTLAQLVLGGGPEALPALLTALSRSGFAVYGPDGQIAVRPAGSAEGLFFEAWQVRSMVGGAGRHKHVSVPLSWLDEGLKVAIPALKGEPVAERLVDGVVQSAQSDDPSVRFWARFVIELGKQSQTYAAYDLAARPASDAVRLDVIQFALIARRLEADLGTAPRAPAAQTARRSGWLSMPVVYAAEPCTPSGPPPRDHASRTVFQQLMHWFTTPGRAINSLVSDSIANLMDYAMLTLMMSALKVDVEMESAPPLRRTKTTTAGEPKKIKSVVTLDGTPLEWANCYRAWLNSHGRELRSYPRSNGPVPNVAVDFDLHDAGLVRIPTSAPPAERGLPGATMTDQQGLARLALEGMPQDHNLNDPTREQRKRAEVTVSATVKMSDLLTRSHPTSGLASIDVVHEWVTQQDFQIDVPYPFEVIDWSEGPARWTGTITVVETIISQSSGRSSFDQGAHTISDTETTKLTVQVTETVSDIGVFASLKGKVEGEYTRLKTHAGWTRGSCGQITNRQMNNTSRERAAGSGKGDTTISVTIFDDGAYLIAASSDGFSMPVTGEFSGELDVFRPAGQGGCTVVVKSDQRPHAPMERSMGGMVQANGRVDSRNTSVLSGSITEDVPSGSGENTTWRTKTTTWSLRRQ